MALRTGYRPQPAPRVAKAAGAGLVIRASTPDDVAAMAAIYASSLAAGIATFEDAPPTPAAIAERRDAVLAHGLPHLVALDPDGEVVAWAWATPFRLRAAYRQTVECSIYVRADRRGRGLGRRLLQALIEACEDQGLAQMVAVVGDARNTASLALHHGHGFEIVGVFAGIGFKPGEWVDTVMLQRPLRGALRPPPGRLS